MRIRYDSLSLSEFHRKSGQKQPNTRTFETLYVFITLHSSCTVHAYGEGDENVKKNVTVGHNIIVLNYNNL